MSFSSLVQDLSLRDGNAPRRRGDASVSTITSAMDDRASRTSHISRAMSYTSTAATSVSIAGDISSQLHSGYSHPLARSWQAERQLTKVSRPHMLTVILANSACPVDAHLPSVHLRPG